jgi:outer membrane receptor protein involved in Fe transport
MVHVERGMTTRGLLPRLLAAATLLALASPGPAPGQESEPAPPPAVEDPAALPAPAPPGIEAIEVTGERLDAADVQDEAQAITAFSGADLDRASIVNVDTLAFNVPGLHVGQSGTAPIITLRGIGTENASLTGEPGVAFHVDGINLARPAAARVAFFDLETLDVKRGPQGLLGGKNSTSGSINLITKKPIDEYEVAGDVLFGNYDRVRMRGALNVPLPLFGEGSAARFAYYHEDRDGYLDDLDRGDSRDAFDADDHGLRAHFNWAPSDTFRWLFSYNWFEQGGVGTQADVVPRYREGNPCTLPASPLRAAAPRTLDDGRTAWVPEFVNVVVDTHLSPTSACAKRTIVIPQGPVPGWVDPDLGDTGGASGPARMTAYRDPATGEVLIDARTGLAIPMQVRQGTNSDGSKYTRFAKQELFTFVPPSEETDRRAIHVDTPASQENRYWGWSTQLDWDATPIPLLGETQLKLLGGYQYTGGDFDQDFDATDAAIVSYELLDEADQYSAELQWGGLLSERFEWQTSLFYLHEEAGRDVAVPDLLNPHKRGTFIEQTTNNKSYGAALNSIFHAAENLRLSLGGRFIKDKKQTFLQNYSGANTSFLGCTGDVGYTANPNIQSKPGPPWFGDRPFYDNETCSELYRGTTWGAGLDWRPFGAEHLLYAKLDRGYKSGGFQAGTVGTYVPEKIWAYAVGSKSSFFDQRLTVNLEGFFYAYQDLQLVILDGFTLRTENTDARMHGFDLETDASPIDGLNLSAVVSFLKTETLDYLSLDPTTEPPGPGINEALFITYQNKRLLERESAEAYYRAGVRDPGGVGYYENHQCFSGYDASPGSGSSAPRDCGDLAGTTNGLDDFSGNHLPRAPEWKFTLTGEYEIPLGRFGSVTPRIQYTWQDDTYFRAFNRDFDLQEDHHLTNAKLIWTSPEQAWTAELFVENIEDETPKQNILVGPRQIDSPPLVWYGPPRFYGFQIGFRY